MLTNTEDHSTMNLRNRRCNCIPVPLSSPKAGAPLIIGGLCLLPIIHPGGVGARRRAVHGLAAANPSTFKTVTPSFGLHTA